MEGDTIIRVGHVMRDGQVLNDIHVFKQGPDASITDIIAVRLAVWEDDHWTTFDVKRVGGRRHRTPPAWNTQLRPEQFVHFDQPIRTSFP